MRIYIVRHGQSVWNAEQRWQGWADIELSAEGEAQAESAAPALSGRGIDAVVTSDLVRSRRTAEVLAAAIDVATVQLDEGWRERDVGEWSGLTTPEVEARHPGQLAAWRAGGISEPPGGEADGHLRARVLAALDRAAGAGACPLVVTHGGVIRTLVRALGGTPFSVPNLGGCVVETEGDGFSVGDTLDLLGVGQPATTVL